MAHLDLSLQMGTLYASGDASTFTGTGGPWGFSPFTSQFGGVVSSAGLATEPFNDTVLNVAPGDEVIFVIALQNLTPGQNAFDVALHAALPAGFTVPTDGTNLSVTDGAGNPIAFNGDLFGGNLQLAAPVAPYAADSGANVVLLTYSLVAGASLPGPDATIVAGASLVHAAETAGGADEAAGLAAATNLVSAAPMPVVQAETSAAAVAKGQTIAFDVSVAVPAGTMRDVRLDTVLPAGLSQLKLRSAAITAVGSGLTVGNTTAGTDGSLALGTVSSTGDPQGNTLTVRVLLEADGTSSGNALLQTVLSAASTDGSRWSATVGNSVGVVVPPAPPGIGGVWSTQAIGQGGALHPLGGLVLSGAAPGSATLAVTLRDGSLGQLSGGSGSFNSTGSTFVMFGTFAELQAAARQLVFKAAVAGTEQFTVSLLDANGGLAQDAGTSVDIAADASSTVQVASGGTLWATTMPSTLILRGQNSKARADAVSGTPMVVGFGAGDSLTLPGTSATLSYAPAGAGGTLLVGGTALALSGIYDASWFTAEVADPGMVTLSFRADPLFDGNRYLASNPDVAAAGVDPFQHFLSSGWREGRSPDAWFDPSFYLRQNPSVAATGVNPLLHYEAGGWQAGYDPSALFSTRDYLAANPDVAKAGVNPLQHYIVSGQNEGRAAFHTAALPLNPLITPATYYAANPDVRQAGANANDHYLTTGWREGRNPDAFFDTHFYLTRNPDVAAAGLDPLLHYQNNGWAEGRAPSLLFDGAKYLAANPDVKAAGMNPLAHYIQFGQDEGRRAELWGGTLPQDALVDPSFLDPALGATLIPSGTAAAQQAAWLYDTIGWNKGLDPNQWFSTSYYLAHNPDVAAAHVNPLQHFELFGWREGRDPSAAFSLTRYLGANPDVAAANMDPLLHYVAHGVMEGRQSWAV